MDGGCLADQPAEVFVLGFVKASQEIVVRAWLRWWDNEDELHVLLFQVYVSVFDVNNRRFSPCIDKDA